MVDSVHKRLTRRAIFALLVTLPMAAEAQTVIMRRVLPGVKPGSPADTMPILPSDPRDQVAACDPSTESCSPQDEIYDYAWFANCSAPPSMYCLRYDKASGGLSAGTEAECAKAQPTTGVLAQYLTILDGFSSGRKPTTVELYEKCGIRDVYDKGWSVDCTTRETAVCIGTNTYTGDTKQFPDADCTTVATTTQAAYAKAVGLVPGGPKPDMGRMCGTKAVPSQYGPWRVYNSSTDNAGSAALGDAFACSGRAGRIIRMSCSYQGGALPSNGQDCDYQTDEFIASQAGKSTAVLQNVGQGMIVETRYHGEDALLFASCTWKADVDPDNPDRAVCTATNYQAATSDPYQLGVEAFQNGTCGSQITRLDQSARSIENPHWVNYLGDGSGGVNGARAYCVASGIPAGSDLTYSNLWAPGACDAIPNPGGVGNGQ